MFNLFKQSEEEEKILFKTGVKFIIRHRKYINKENYLRIC